jgi:septal ring factor EnvC (AmiA/AmiB activator)
MFTRRAVVLAAVPAALLLTGVFEGHRAARAEDTVQAALDRREARIAASEKRTAALRRDTAALKEHTSELNEGTAALNDEAARLRKSNACGKFLLQHADDVDPDGDLCAQARAESRKRGIPLPVAAIGD